jgi:hypothetical protein
MNDHGLGWLPSPLDPRDFPIEQLYALRGIEKPLTLAASYQVPDVPPVLDQGTAPQCVAYSTSGLKAQQDRIDQGQFFDFDEPRFFGQIGGTANGAVLRVAFDQMLHLGYPVVGSVDGAKDHKVAAYYAVPITPDELQAAILAFGPVVVGMAWSVAFDNPPSSGILRKPSGTNRGGHAILVIGWTTIAGILYFILQNSWGTAWGLGGRCYLAASYVGQVVGEAWKAVDQIVPSEADMKFLTPYPRLFDGPVPAGTVKTIQVAGLAGIPTNATAVEIILRVDKALETGWVYAGPDPSPLIFGKDPKVGGVPSTLDYNAGQIQNLAVSVALKDGKLTIWSTKALPRLVIDAPAYA